MKQIKLLGTLLMVILVFSSCSDDDKENICKNELEPVTNAKLVEITTTAIGSQNSLEKQTGDFVKFSFNKGKVVSGDDWDFAIRGRLIITNGKKGNGPYIFGDKEPKRTSGVQVVTTLGKFEDVNDLGGFVATDWHMDYHYAQGYYEEIATAISFKSTTEHVSGGRQSWHLRSYKDGELLLLRPVVFLFKTHDDHVAKMVIEKIDRTNTDFDKKEDVTYTMKYYYNTDKSSISLDEK